MMIILFLAENSSSHNTKIYNSSKEIVSFLPINAELVRLNATWKEQIKNERDRVRRRLIAGNQIQDNQRLSFDPVTDAIVTVINSRATHFDQFDPINTIPPLVSVTTKFPSQQTIVDEFTLNREQRAAFLIITSHLDGDARCRRSKYSLRNKRILVI